MTEINSEIMTISTDYSFLVKVFKYFQFQDICLKKSLGMFEEVETKLMECESIFSTRVNNKFVGEVGVLRPQNGEKFGIMTSFRNLQNYCEIWGPVPTVLTRVENLREEII